MLYKDRDAQGSLERQFLATPSEKMLAEQMKSVPVDIKYLKQQLQDISDLVAASMGLPTSTDAIMPPMDVMVSTSEVEEVVKK